MTYWSIAPKAWNNFKTMTYAIYSAPSGLLIGNNMLAMTSLLTLKTKKNISKINIKSLERETQAKSTSISSEIITNSIRFQKRWPIIHISINQLLRKKIKMMITLQWLKLFGKLSQKGMRGKPSFAQFENWKVVSIMIAICWNVMLSSLI